MNNKSRIAELEAEIKSLRKLGRTKREPIKGVGGVIQMQREARGIGLQALARKSGVAAGLLSNMESGRLKNPTWATIKGLAKGLGIRASVLVAGFETAEEAK